MYLSSKANDRLPHRYMTQSFWLHKLILAMVVTLTVWSAPLASAAPPYRNAAEALAGFETHALETLIPADKQGWQALDADDSYHDCLDGTLLTSGAINRDGSLSITAAQKRQLMEFWQETSKSVCLRIAGHTSWFTVHMKDSGQSKLALIRDGSDVYPGESFAQGTESLAAAFDTFSVNALDTLLPGGRTWRIVRGENGLLPEVDTTPETVLEGSVDAEGKIKLTPAQQKRAGELLQQHPDELGIIFAGHLSQFRLNTLPGGVEIALPAYDDRERIRRLHARWKSYPSVQEALTTFTIDLNTDLEVFPALLPEEIKNWRLLRRTLQDGRIIQEKLIASGKLGDDELALTYDQGKKLWQAWKRHPDQIWLDAGHAAFRLSARKIPDGRYVLDLLGHTGMDPRSARILHLERQQKIDPSFYTQADFPVSKYQQEYQEWKGRFEADLKKLQYTLSTSTALPWRDLKASESQLQALDATEQQVLASLFANSIDGGRKGMILRLLLIEAFFSRDRRVLPAGTAMVKLLTDPQTRPVGYGGVFRDGTNPVELWYVAFDNPQEWTIETLEKNIIYREFQPMKLPGYGDIVRNRWPALTFNRDANGQLRLYAISAELATIIQSIFNAQTS